MKHIDFNLRYLFAVIFFILYPALTRSQDHKTPGDTISFLFIGDIMGHDDQILAAHDSVNNTYNYDDVFKYVKPLISETDIAIANFEVTLAGPPYKGYPQFSSPAELAVACYNAGIDCLVTANNHVADRGNKGIISTINKLDSINFPHTGSFLNSDCRDSLSPLILKYSGTSVALINYTYGTNGIAVEYPVKVNMLDRELISEDIKSAKRANADIIILFLHWGTEYDTIPSGYQTDLSEYFFSLGVDMIIGSHPHVLQKMVWSKDTVSKKDEILVYSLGNFVSNQRRPNTDGGSMVRVVMTRKEDRYVVSDAGFYLTWVYIPSEEPKKKYFILPCSQFERNPGFFKESDDFTRLKKFTDNSRAYLLKQNINIREYVFNGNAWVLSN